MEETREVSSPYVPSLASQHAVNANMSDACCYATDATHVTSPSAIAALVANLSAWVSASSSNGVSDVISEDVWNKCFVER